MLRYINTFKNSLKNTYYKTKDIVPILIYHRVASIDTDPQMLTVNPKNFDDQIKYLKSRFNIISLQELVKSLRNGIIPKNAIAITFDDGYADNLYNAKPILEKYNVPATVFISPGITDTKKEFWWDQLERIFLLNNNIYKSLEMTIDGNLYFWDIKTYKDAQSIYNQLHPLLKYITSSERDNCITRLLEWAGLTEDGRESLRTLTSSEIIELAKGGLIEIGAHTMSHCTLIIESKEKQEWEIKESKAILEKIIGKEVLSFSYPYGGIDDASLESQEIVRKSGFNCGIANVQKCVDLKTDLFWIPRRLVRNWDLNYFQENIDSFLYLNSNDIFDLAKKVFLSKYIAQKTYAKELIPLVKIKYDKNNLQNKIDSVVQVNTLDNVGGAAKVAYRLHNSLNAKGFKSQMIVNHSISDDENVSILLQSNTRKQHILNYAQEKMGWMDFFNMQSLKIKDTETYKKGSVIHLHNLHGGYFSPFALPMLSNSKPTIWTLHDMQAITGYCAHSFECHKWECGCNGCPDLNISGGLKKDTTAFIWQNKKLIYNNSNLNIVCPSNWLKQKVERSILKDKPIHLIYNGIDNSIFYKQNKMLSRNALGLPQNKTILLFNAHGGTDNIWKGGSYLSEVYKELSQKYDLLFINIGGDITSYKSEDWFDVSYITDEKTMALYYSAANLFLYPSLADNCPLVVLESLACGTPVIAFRTGGIPELISNLNNGYVANYKDKNDFINGIKMFLDNPEKMATAYDIASQSVLSKFTLEQMVSSYLELYNKVGEEFYG